MTVTFDPALATDVDLVRFHVGDTDTEASYLQNETIQYFLDETESVGETVIKCLTYIITQLSSPNFTKDWLSVSNDSARKGYEDLLNRKRIEFGLPVAVASASVSHPHRADNYTNEDGVYEDITGDP